MFTSQQLRAVVAPGSLVIREHRLDDVVHQIEIRGNLAVANVPEVARRLDAILANGVRWLIVDVETVDPIDDVMLAALVATARELRSRRGELILAGAGASAAERLAAYEVAQRPALAANVDQAIMILKMLRPKTSITRPGGRAKQRITSLTLPRVEPRPHS